MKTRAERHVMNLIQGFLAYGFVWIITPDRSFWIRLLAVAVLAAVLSLSESLARE